MAEKRYPTSIDGVTAKAIYRKSHLGDAVGNRPLTTKTWVREFPLSIADLEKMMPTKDNTGKKPCVVTSQPTKNKEEEVNEEGIKLLRGCDDIPVVEREEPVPKYSSYCSKMCLWYIATCCANIEPDDD
ncbi:uncharacterized protein [Anabrus simplex]|uniref:uncharacterized protein n=1 Tax=Anabrus simplex TaxID=316456 RepID=UPI0035A2D75A